MGGTSTRWSRKRIIRPSSLPARGRRTHRGGGEDSSGLAAWLVWTASKRHSRSGSILRFVADQECRRGLIQAGHAAALQLRGCAIVEKREAGASKRVRPVSAQHKYPSWSNDGGDCVCGRPSSVCQRWRKYCGLVGVEKAEDSSSEAARKTSWAIPITPRTNPARGFEGADGTVPLIGGTQGEGGGVKRGKAPHPSPLHRMGRGRTFGAFLGLVLQRSRVACRRGRASCFLTTGLERMRFEVTAGNGRLMESALQLRAFGNDESFEWKRVGLGGSLVDGGPGFAGFVTAEPLQDG